MKDYWYPFYPSRFKADTMHLTAEQDGIYRRLIDHYMETKLPLPSSDAALARIAGITESLMADNWGVLSVFFEFKDEKLYLKKCDEVLKDQSKRNKKKTVRAKKGAASRWKHKKKTVMLNGCLDDAKPMLGDATEHNITEHNKTKEVKKPSKKISTLTEFENHKLEGHYHDWFKEKCPNVNRIELRDNLARWCKSKGKKYKDYWSALQTWATKEQKQYNENNKHAGNRRQASDW